MKKKANIAKHDYYLKGSKAYNEALRCCLFFKQNSRLSQKV